MNFEDIHEKETEELPFVNYRLRQTIIIKFRNWRSGRIIIYSRHDCSLAKTRSMTEVFKFSEKYKS